jgi:putative nucleotidyltransferase with HDIG domain
MERYTKYKTGIRRHHGPRAARDGRGYRLVKLSRFFLRALQLAGTAAVFALASKVSALFSFPSGASFLFPPAGVSLAAGAAFGGWGVAGVILGVVMVPWGAATTPAGMALFCLVNGAAAAIPAWALRRPRGSTATRLRRAFLFGGLLNNLASAALGGFSLALLGRLPWEVQPLARNFFSWWMSDLMAALVLGLPVLLWLRPEVLVTEAQREVLRGWLRDRPAVLECVLMVLAGIAGIVAVDHLGWVFPHWLAIALIIPIAVAAFEGGVGAALIVNGLASVGYVATLMASSGRDPARLQEILAPGYTTVGVFSMFALVGGWLAGRNRRLLRQVQAHEEQLERDFERTVAALAAAIEAKDPTTEGHVQRVAHLAVLVGRRLAMEERELRLLRYGAMLHDVGKIGVPESILNKPECLTPGEKQVMEEHVEIGLRIIRDVEALREVEPLIRYHQERWDGARAGVRFPGYFGLAGEEIPLGARVLSVVDAFDAITHDRPYRRGAPVELALDELRREAGRQFDPRLVEMLHDVLREGEWLPQTVERPAVAPEVPEGVGRATSPQTPLLKERGFESVVPPLL